MALSRRLGALDASNHPTLRRAILRGTRSAPLLDPAVVGGAQALGIASSLIPADVAPVSTTGRHAYDGAMHVLADAPGGKLRLIPFFSLRDIGRSRNASPSWTSFVELVAPKAAPGADLVRYDPEFASRQILNQPGASGYAETPGGRTVSVHAAVGRDYRQCRQPAGTAVWTLAMHLPCSLATLDPTTGQVRVTPILRQPKRQVLFVPVRARFVRT